MGKGDKRKGKRRKEVEKREVEEGVEMEGMTKRDCIFAVGGNVTSSKLRPPHTRQHISCNSNERDL